MYTFSKNLHYFMVSLSTTRLFGSPGPRASGMGVNGGGGGGVAILHSIDCLFSNGTS